MIKYDSLGSILESFYLDTPLTHKISDVNIVVNPVKPQYLSGKLIIINSRDYIIPKDFGYGNKVITRLSCYPELQYVPYIPRIIPKIRWNGMYINDESELMLGVTYMYDEDSLYFPKIRGYEEKEKELDYLGYLEYQVGYNYYDDPNYRDLDLLKCREGLL